MPERPGRGEGDFVEIYYLDGSYFTVFFSTFQAIICGLQNTINSSGALVYSMKDNKFDQ